MTKRRAGPHVERPKAERAQRPPQENRETLQATVHHLSLIYDAMLDVMFLLKVEPHDCFRFTSVNRAFLTVTGLTQEQVIGKRVEEVLPESSHALVIGKYKEAIQNRKPVEWDGTASFPAGTRVGAVRVTPLFDQRGRCSDLLGRVHDVTDRQLAEEALRESEERYRSLFENMLEGFAYCRMLFENKRPQDFIYLDVNRAFEN